MICVVVAGILIGSPYKCNHTRSGVFLKVLNVMQNPSSSWMISCISCGKIQLWMSAATPKPTIMGMFVKVHLPWYQARSCSCWPRWTLECLGHEDPTTYSWEACVSSGWLVFMCFHGQWVVKNTCSSSWSLKGETDRHLHWWFGHFWSSMSEFGKVNDSLQTKVQSPGCFFLCRGPYHVSWFRSQYQYHIMFCNIFHICSFAACDSCKLEGQQACNKAFDVSHCPTFPQR